MHQRYAMHEFLPVAHGLEPDRSSEPEPTAGGDAYTELVEGNGLPSFLSGDC